MQHLLDFKFITVFTTIGTAGVLAGLASGIKPYFVNVTYTTLILQFAILYLYTNVFSPAPKIARGPPTEKPSEQKMMAIRASMVVFAFIGGFITANIGSGSDIMLYGFGVYVWNVALADTGMQLPENALTASSVVVMGLLSIVTACARGFTVGISMNVWYCLGAASWLVCWGAPLGSLFLTPALQMTLRAVFYCAAVIQFGFFAGLKIEFGKPASNLRMSSTTTWLLIMAITICSLVGVAFHFVKTRAKLEQKVRPHVVPPHLTLTAGASLGLVRAAPFPSETVLRLHMSARYVQGGFVPVTLAGTLSRLVPGFSANPGSAPAATGIAVEVVQSQSSV